MAASNVEELAVRVQSMTTADKLRLAAGLVDRGETEMAEVVADLAVTDLQAARLFGKTAKPPRKQAVAKDGR